MNRYFQKIREKLVRIQEEPQKVSRGYALGVFLGTTPFIGLKVFIALLLTSAFRWSRVASVVGVYHINILTAPVFYGISFLVGKMVTGSQVQYTMPHPMSFKAVCDLLYGNVPLFLSLLAGGFVLGIPMAVGAYFIASTLIRKSIPQKLT